MPSQDIETIIRVQIKLAVKTGNLTFTSTKARNWFVKDLTEKLAAMVESPPTVGEWARTRLRATIHRPRGDGPKGKGQAIATAADSAKGDEVHQAALAKRKKMWG